MSSFEDFLNAIAGQESGGDYSVVNKDSGALGRWQVMPSNVASWSKEVLGYSITPSQFLNSPALQEQIVRGKLQGYYNQYGAAGAASAWYSGDPSLATDTRSQNGYPSIKSYVDSVLSRMGGDYGYVSTKTIDNRTKNSALADLMPQDSGAKLDALSGTDRNGLGLQQIKATGTEAASGGMGIGAPQVAGTATDQGNGKAAVGSEFQQRWDAAGQMLDQKTDGLRGAVIDLAKQYVGTPYVWGGSQPGGFDCSGLIQYAMQSAGISFPRVSWDQISAGTRTDVNALKPGDLVGFGDGGHIAIWLGDNQILEAPRTGLDVRIRDLGKNEDAFGVSLDNWYK